MPPDARPPVESAVDAGFIAGLNDILLIGGLMGLAGAVLALWLVREHDIEREPLEAEPVADPAAA